MTQKKAKVLVTNADYKHTLGIVRSLGKAGYYVIAMDSKRKAQSFFSRYCQERVICPDPGEEERFIQFLRQYLQENRVDVLLPAGNNTTVTISKYKQELQSFTEIPVADYSSIRIASDKDATMKLARLSGIAVPKEYRSVNEIEGFPVVAKGFYGSGKVKYLNSPDDLRHIDLKQHILQEYIPGEGYGFYTLFNHGKLKALFMHKRLREYPITGGPSSCAMSIYDEELKRLGLGLMDRLRWHGVAMVEFKKDSRDNKFKLMEINPRFWGSLDLSVAAGVDFPKLVVEMALNGDIEPVMDYKLNVKFRWPFPDDILHLCANPASIREMIAEIFDMNTRSNIVISDPVPTLVQILKTPLPILFKLWRGTLKYPQGRPMVHR